MEIISLESQNITRSECNNRSSALGGKSQATHLYEKDEEDHKFLTKDKLERLAAEIKITNITIKNPNAMWEDIKAEVVQTCQKVIDAKKCGKDKCSCGTEDTLGVIEHCRKAKC